MLKERMIPLMGVMAAFIFAAQMLNFPVMGGTSGHLIGAVFAAVLLGPYAAAVVMAVVLIAQCLIFQDGGLTALGANVLNMAVLGPFSGYLIYNIMRRAVKGNAGMIAGAAFASWASVVIASSACAVELSASGTSPFLVVFPSMVFVHAVIGIGEAAITCVMVAFVLKVRPDLIYHKDVKPLGKKDLAFGVAIAVMLYLLAPLASRLPDGLERIAKDKGFSGKTK
jgi:cobalt/nickel transport system permease protein